MTRRVRRGHGPPEDGSAVTLGLFATVVVALVAVVAVEFGAYLLAAARAQTAADGAALAAAATGAPRGGLSGDPEAAARRIAAANGARLTACRCRGAVVTVEVEVAVRALLVPRYAPRQARATAHAGLVRATPRLTDGRPLRDPADP